MPPLEDIKNVLLDALTEIESTARDVLASLDERRLVRVSKKLPGGDVECGAANALFHALRAQSGRYASTTVTCVSPMGVEREHTAKSLATAATELIPNAFASKHFAAVRVHDGGDSGMITICTLERYAELRDAGSAMCDKCGKFISGGERGLWWHRKTRHNDLHQEAMDAVERERNALVAMSTSGSRSDLTNGDAAYLDNKTKKASREDDLREAMAAARRGDATVMDALIAAKRVEALPLPGLEAARRGDLNLLRSLVSRDGWDPRSKDAVDKHGSNALLWAAGAGHVECVEFLVEKCCMNPQTSVQSGRRSYAGRSALHWAARNGHVEVVEYLLSRGVDPNSTTEDGSTAFAWACWQGHLAVMRQLVERAECDYKSCNDYGCNVACWTAMGAGGVECCEYLASLGVPFYLINANGHSCLHKAAQRGNRDVCEWLLDTPSLGLTRDHAQPDAEGYDPAGLALVEGFNDVADWLKARQLELEFANHKP